MMPDDFPTLTPLPENIPSTGNGSSFIGSITWQTWIIIILILALMGINIFVYLAKGTQELSYIIEDIFGPILKLLGYNTLTTAKQTVETSATGTKAGIDIVSSTAIDTIDQLQDTMQQPKGQVQRPIGQQATSSLPVQQQIQQDGGNAEQWNKNSLEMALNNAKQSSYEVSPDDSRSSIQITGKSGWCYIGDDQGVRSCSQIGVNDTCMSGDVFPNQAICMNPNLRA
jgi:hypothetical protein